MKLLRLPGVYGPQLDTRMIIDVVHREPGLRGGRVLDLCTGTGAIALAAAAAGAGRVTAVDVARRAVLTTWLNARAQRLRVTLHRGDLVAPVAGELFDLVLSNPPFVPTDAAGLPQRGPARGWDAGADGRALLDRICTEAPSVLAPGGVLLLVHSGVCSVTTTVAALERAGLAADVVARRTQPFGPLLTARADLLESRGLIPRGQRQEEMVVVRATRVASAQPTSAMTSSVTSKLA